MKLLLSALTLISIASTSPALACPGADGKTCDHKKCSHETAGKKKDCGCAEGKKCEDHKKEKSTSAS